MKTPRTPRFARALAAAAILATVGATHALAVDSKDNAALGYWRAFSLITPAQVDVIRSIGRESFDSPEIILKNDAVLAILRDDSLIDLLIRAASKPDSDFAIEYERGFDALLPHLGPMRTSAQILTLRAALDLSEGRPAHAAACIEAVVRSSEHLVGDRVLISSLVSASIIEHARAVTELGAKNDAFDAGQRAAIIDAVDRFEEDDPFGVIAALRTEARMVADWAEISLAGENGPEMLAKISSGGDAEEARRITEDLPNQIRLYELAMRRSIDAVAARDVAALDTLSEALREGAFGELAKIVIPSLRRTINAMENAEANLQAIRDALTR